MVAKRLLLTLILAHIVAASAAAQSSVIPDGTADAMKAIAKFKVPPGFTIDLWAAEPMLGNPVAFCIDERGRLFVAETYRFNRGTEEYRHRPFFLEGDLANTSVEDRLAMFKKFAQKFPGGMSYFSKYADKVRLLEDRQGKGKADFSSVFADGFNDPLDGLAAGVLAKDGDVYLTCIPKLWKLRDTKGIGKADVKSALHHGFGPQTAFLGHDLHGLVFGPDGKLYFSVGDRGYHVKTREGKILSGPRQGAVFRCDPDGANLEVVHVGLRNPQELAFDQFGNLFAADNNCDKGDHSRLVYIVEGGHSGWNMAYQTMESPYLTGPWHAERMWHLYHKDQPAWIVPPVGKLGAGPSGFVFTSGVGWPKRYQNAFFMCNFTGNGGIDSFRVQPQGAGFELIDYHVFMNPVSATDVDFGYDGKMYLSDWVQFVWDGGGVGKGRIYTVYEPKTVNDPAIRALGKLMKEGFKKTDAKTLYKLLAHPDMRVRLRAQYELAERGPGGELTHIALAEGNRSKEIIPRLHALWALGQMERKKAGAMPAPSCFPLLEDPHPEIRAQAVKVLGDVNWKENSLPALWLKSTIVNLIDDPHPRVRYFAMQTAGKLKLQDFGAQSRILAQIFINKDQDPYLRHAAVMALVNIGDVDSVLDMAKKAADGQLLWAAKSPEGERAIRLAAVLVLRTLNDMRIARFLNDADEQIVTEAARAINDLPLADALPELARLSERYLPRAQQPNEALWRRIINANFRLGHARVLVEIAKSKHVAAPMRQEALACLADWSAPSPRDRVNGVWRPLAKRDAAVVTQLLEDNLAALLAGSTGVVQTELTKLITKVQIKADESIFAAWVADVKRPVEARVAALDLLMARKSQEMPKLLKNALRSGQPLLRAKARELYCTLDPAGAHVYLRLRPTENTLLEQQQIIRLLPRLKTKEGAALLQEVYQAYAAGKLKQELHLDVLEAARAQGAGVWKQFLAQMNVARSPEARLKVYGVTLHGGDAARGKQIFIAHPVAQCIRCHKAEGQGGDAGPDLSAWAPKAKGDRAHFLEALIYPSKKFTPGYGVAMLTLTSGQVLTGTLRAEDKEKITLLLSDGKLREVPTSQIEERANGVSPMPEMGPVLTLEEVRDVIEYLATLK